MIKQLVKFIPYKSCNFLTNKDLIQNWVHAFNQADYQTLESLYAENAMNHQMPNAPVVGKQAIGEMFKAEFKAAPQMHCIPIQMITEGHWVVLEWKDPKGFQGCGFFEIRGGLIETQRGYWDKLSFLELYKEENT